MELQPLRKSEPTKQLLPGQHPNRGISASLTIQPLRTKTGNLQYHIEIDFKDGFSSVVLAPTLETIFPIAFEHIESLVDEGVISKCPPPYQITFADERSSDSTPES